MKKLLPFVVALVMCIACVAGTLLVGAEEPAIPEYYATCYNAGGYYDIASNALLSEDGVKYVHIVSNDTAVDAYFNPAPGWGPTLDYPVLLLKYRSSGGGGEFFFTTGTPGAGSPGTCAAYEFENTGSEWAYAVYDFKAEGFACFDGANTVVNFFRVDLNSIDWLDYSYAAFFKTTAEAEAFRDAEKAGSVSLFEPQVEQGEMKKSLDALAVDENTYPPAANYKGDDTVTIKAGSKLYILGWATNTACNLERIYWTLDDVEKGCSDAYRARGDLSWTAYNANSGFGLDDGFMELLGVDEIAEKTTGQVKIIAEFENGQTLVIKEFKLVVAGDVQLSLDRVYINVDALDNNATSYSGADAITIQQGDKLNLLGWVTKYGTNVDKIFWQYIVGADHKFNEEGVEIITKECSDTYRGREDIAGAIGVDAEYLAKSGFGKDDDLMEMLGVDALEPGVYTVRIRVLFADGSEGVVKKRFNLTVEGTAAPVNPTVDVYLGTEKTAVAPDGTNDVTLSMDGDKLVITTNAGAGDPWVSIPLNNIDTSVYTSFTVKYTVDPETAGNNVYLRDTSVNPGYSGASGTWSGPDMNGKTEKTYVIAENFPTMAGTTLTGVRFVAATPGGTLVIESITFKKTEDETPIVAEPAVSTDNTTYAVDADVTVTFEGSASNKDWIAIAPSGTEYTDVPAAEKVWVYTSGTQTSADAAIAEGSVVLSMAGLVPGQYTVYFFSNDGYDVLATAEITVEEDVPPTTEEPPVTEEPVQTGDFAVTMFAVIMVLAMGAAVVFMKKRAF